MSQNNAQDIQNQKAVLVIHGGAGVIERKYMTLEKELVYKATLEQALMAGYQTLQEGKTSVDAVQATIHIMEDSPLFNAGRGAVFTHEGKNEMDAAIMNGASLEAGLWQIFLLLKILLMRRERLWKNPGMSYWRAEALKNLHRKRDVL